MFGKKSCKIKSSKGFLNILELIIVVTILIAAYSFLFPRFAYVTEWDGALIRIQGRDTILTIDRMGKLYDYSFNTTGLDDFLNRLFPATSMLMWSKTTGAPKQRIELACFCTEQQISELSRRLDDIKINGRLVDFVIYNTSLTEINPSDVLLIWGYQDLSSPTIRSELEDYLGEGNGVVEIMDFETGVLLDSTQTDLFGLSEATEWGSGGSVVVKPAKATNMTYQSYKLFYRLPLLLKAPTQQPLATCTDSNNTGTFKIRDTSYQFWICDAGSAYFDTNADGVEDTGALILGDTFTIEGFNFNLKYIDSATRIRVSFDWENDYVFSDFIESAGIKQITSPSGVDKILIYRENPGVTERAAGVVLNDYAGSRTAWVADFTRVGFGGDDHRLLLTSLLLWASNKETKEILLENLNIGFKTSYINVKNTDMYEVYTFDFGLGYPY